MSADRVNELYYGQILTRESQDACRDRIHWMCGQVTGERVLDVGCSQGIASLILAREGRKVVGIDIRQDAIDHANAEVGSLPTAAQANISFQVVTPGRFPFEDHAFDSVLLGEIIEHTTRPEELIDEAARLLKPGGRIVITTPFGVLPHPEHVMTYFLTNFVNIVRPRMAVTALEIRHKYLCCAGSPGMQQDESLLCPQRLLEMSEAAFERAEWAYIDLGAKRKRALERATKDSKKNEELAARLKEAQKLAAGCKDLTEKQQLVFKALGRRVAHLPSGPQREWLLARLTDLPNSAPKVVSQWIDLLSEQEAAETREREARAVAAALKGPTAERAQLEKRLAAMTQTATADKSRLDAEVSRLRKESEATRAELKKEKAELRRLRGRVARREQQLEYANECLRLKGEEVRYKLGDALVRAYGSPGEFARLPGRVMGLLTEGLRRRRSRSLVTDDFVPTPLPGKASVPAMPTPAQLASPRQNGSEKSAGKPGPVVVKDKDSDKPPLVFKAVERPIRAPRFKLRAAVIMDEFTYECFSDQCEMVRISPQHWREELEAAKPDFLFVESVWAGNGGKWKFQVSKADNVPDNPLPKVAAWCRERGIPSAFWCKEDPPHFERFLPAARMFDHVFTSDANCVPHYRERLGHDRIYPLAFAASPDIHHPIDSKRERPGDVCFAGTYYRNKYPDRARDMEILLTPALAWGLHIYDRQADFSANDAYRFPDLFQPSVKGSLDYLEMVDAYKKYKVFLNVNSVKDSPTMFSRRVLELLACGTAVISTESLGIREMLGEDAVALVRSEPESRETLEMLMRSPEFRERMVLRGQRRIFAEHTYEHRFVQIARTLGFDINVTSRRVCVVSCTNRPQHLDNLVENYQRQLYSDRELLVVLNNDSFNIDEVRAKLAEVPHTRVLRVPEAETLGPCLNRAIDETEADTVAKFDDDDFYAPHYLTDLMPAFVYSDARIVGKRCYYAYLAGQNCLTLRFPNKEHGYTKFVAGATLLLDRDVARDIRFGPEPRGVDTAFQERARADGVKIYSGDRFNFTAIRSPAADAHTWQISDREFLGKSKVVAFVDKYDSHVTV
ncbi:MAG: methyltransferase domain-containing protein [Phycisphaerales bacterium]|nr:methyltransferase domain-containing protein [Phycisphaerales bacterium]